MHLIAHKTRGISRVLYMELLFCDGFGASGLIGFLPAVARNDGGQQLDHQPGAHARAGVDDVDADIACAFKLAQIALHGAARFAEGLHQPCDGDFGRAAVAVAAVDIFRQLAGAAARAVGQVAVVVDPRGHLRHVGAAVARRGRKSGLFGGQPAGAAERIGERN